MSKNSLIAAAFAALVLGLGAAPSADAKVTRSIARPGTTSADVSYPPICGYAIHGPIYCKRW